MIKYKNVTKWAYIKSYLMDAFEDTTTASSLQIQLNSIKMRHGEDVNDYCHRVEKLYYKLCTACTLNKEKSEAKIIHETLKEQTLTIFIKGLISPIKTIVKARNPKTLEFHDSKLGGHLGVNNTIKRIQKQFRWKGIKDDVKKYVKNCTSCQVNKISNRHVKQPMAITSTSTKPFEKIFLDIVGPLPTTLSSNNYILTMQDDLSKYTLGVPIPNHQANTVAEAFVIHFVCVHGIPGTILTDQGTDFLSKTFTEVCKLLKINKVNTSPFRPQTNGGLERSHRTLAEYLRYYVDKNLNNWDHLLPYAFFVYNSTIHTSTNFQPYALVYGRTLEIPIKLKIKPEPQYNYDDYLYDLKQSMQVSHKLAREKLIEHKVKSKERYDKNENPVDIHVKDLVLLKDNAHKNKLNSLWLGPYEVTEIIGDENIVIQRDQRGTTVHKNNVKQFYNDKAND
ncbi:hypothetical protein AGLY_014376 [Aphis glycines]|uniref:RNA-directed DNA polymerase n=1 Tax=Aphis glycines TaxID=307491 RepID=A0A6G0T4G6_APHGL|nr:hypothetical protein AGLY_014376 [Aphis glycines]